MLEDLNQQTTMKDLAGAALAEQKRLEALKKRDELTKTIDKRVSDFEETCDINTSAKKIKKQVVLNKEEPNKDFGYQEGYDKAVINGWRVVGTITFIIIALCSAVFTCGYLFGFIG